jgi:hypothetical protein
MAARHPPCRALKPKEKDYKVTDRDGMYVHVTAKGAMSFRMDYRLNGRRETIYLGKYGPEGLSRSQRGFQSGVLAASTPWLVRSDRPSSIVAPNRHITKMEIDGAAGGLTIGPSRVEQLRAAQAIMRRAGFLGHHPPRDKEHHLASRKCRRERTPEGSELLPIGSWRS